MERPLPLCGGEPGKSDRFMIWPDRAENLGEVCAQNGLKGIWSCRQCGASGDTIAYLTKVEGMDFKAALAELGIEGRRPSFRRRRAPAEPRRESSRWEPQQWPEPTEPWCEYAGKLLAEAEAVIWEEPTALAWLAKRGISEEAVRAYRIGYLRAESGRFPGRFRARAALGLPPRKGDDGREHTRIFIPRGIVIPTLGADGRVLNLRIRRHKQDLRERSPKYLELEGSCKAPLLLSSSRPAPLAAYFVTEAELDAILIHYATGGVVGALAVRTNRGKPDAHAHERLRQAVRIGIALDYDGPGAGWSSGSGITRPACAGRRRKAKIPAMPSALVWTSGSGSAPACLTASPCLRAWSPTGAAYHRMAALNSMMRMMGKWTLLSLVR